MVSDYRAERMRQLAQAERVSANYAAEYAAYVQEHPLVTFKQWIVSRAA